MKIKNLKVELASYSIFLYVGAVLTSSLSLASCNKKVDTSIKLAEFVPAEYKMVEIEEEVEKIEEDNGIPLFDTNDDYYDIDNNEYCTNEELMNTDNFVITIDNKTYENLSLDDFELFTAVVATESTDNIYDALAVASSVANRCDSDKWVEYVNSYGKDGENPIDQLTFSGQYEGYLNGSYEAYLNGSLEVPVEVEDACATVWFGGIRNHNFCSFRASHATSYSDMQIVEGGNRFDDEIAKAYYR